MAGFFNRNLMLRIATAVVGLPVLIAFLELGGWYVSVGLLVATALSATEYFLVQAKGDRPTQLVGIAAATALGALSTWGPLMPIHDTRAVSAGLLVLMCVLMFIAAFFLVHTGDMASAWPRLAMLVGGALYTGLPLTFLARARELPDGRLWCYLPMVLTWGNDTFAYFCGRLLGKHKMAPHISPGKTWEGFGGALLLTVGTAFAWRALAQPAFTVADCVALGVCISVLGPIGDLTESVWKRSNGIKDSGNLLPGHGGLLDRIDALMFTAPFLYFYAAFMHPWNALGN
ncbi:MAG: phosphatidate cytidylyltransferase [Deltaproteobacteria bacterium]|nr:phosphatidate cytidylyltransferase [Deltaproteobacteria bacterium]